MCKFNVSFTLVTLLLLSACTTQVVRETPLSTVSNDEHQNQGEVTYTSPCLQISLQNTKPAIKVGYGSGRTVAEAKQQAMYDIANQLQVNISGSATRHANKTDGVVSTQFSQEIKTQANAILTSVETTCSDTNDPSGTFHFALLYDQRPLINIFADHISAQLWQGKPGTIQWQGASLIITSPFIKQLERKLIDPSQTSNVTMQVQLFRKSQQWHLAINGVIHPIQDTDYHQLFNWSALKSTEMSVQLHDEFGKTLPPHFRDEDEFKFYINSQQPGYLSVFDVYEDGRVIKVRENMPIDNTLVLPEHKGSFSAGLLVENHTTIDQFIFLITPEKIDANAFNQLMSDNSSQQQNNYYINLFLHWIDQQKTIATTVMQLETVPR